jgi:alpha-L-fucosidase
MVKSKLFIRTLKCLAIILLVGCCSLPVALAQERYQPNWGSIDQRPTPQWFKDAKFGIFIHWGVYSVPAWAPTKDVGIYARYSEWYWKRLTEEMEGHAQFRAFHDATYGSGVKYQDFVKDFKAEMYDPDLWADVFQRSGARYIVLTSKHHDGFCLWPSPQSWNWNAADVGPHRDLAGDLVEAVRKRGLRMGFYYSLYEWYNPLYHHDVDRYIETHMLPQMKDLVNRYKPDVFWPDGEWDHPSSRWRSQEFLAWLYNESPVGKEVAVNDRWGKETRSKHGGYYTTEYSLVHDQEISSEAADHTWEECRGIGHSFGYNRAETYADYASGEKLVHLLVDLVSKGGNLLLDIGPTADGRIPVIMQDRLIQMGDWLRVNGEAIYGTEKWTRTADSNENVRYTKKDADVYALALGWPGRELTLQVDRPPAGTKVTMLGSDKDLPWRFEDGTLLVDLSAIGPGDLPCQHAFAFRISGLLAISR